jgi:Ca-activated chloride channel family protein
VTHQTSRILLHRRRLATSAAIAALALGTLAVAGCEQEQTKTAQKVEPQKPVEPARHVPPVTAPAQPAKAVPLSPALEAERKQLLAELQVLQRQAAAASSDVRNAKVKEFEIRRRAFEARAGQPLQTQHGRVEGFRFGHHGDFGYSAGIAPSYAPRQSAYSLAGTSADKFPDAPSNGIKIVGEEPVSTFSADVDTASYAVLRKFLTGAALPPATSVRVEEMVNYFDYKYALPDNRAEPFRPTVSVYQTPWNPDTQIVHIGIKGFDIPRSVRPAANLVFLLDVSGSMSSPDKLPLVQQSMRMLVNELDEKDSVSIVVYAGAAGTVLEPTSGANKRTILAAIDRLSAGGSTAGAEGIRQAYQLARSSFIRNGVNRVILATDGDFNVGITDPNQLEDFVARERASGVTLTCLGFGMGNYNDALMQKLAQKGNGNAAYIDTINEARKVLVEQVNGTLFTIAKDVKFQIEFNPARVSEYRLVGYETRMLNREDFNNDKVDAGDIGAGHAVTALYEIVPAGSKGHLMDPLRYGAAKPVAPTKTNGNSDEIAFLRLRYKLPNEEQSRLIERPVTNGDVIADVRRGSDDLRFAAAVAGFGQLLRNDPYMKGFGYADVATLAAGARGDDPQGHRAEFVQLVRLAQALPALEQHAEGGR